VCVLQGFLLKYCSKWQCSRFIAFRVEDAAILRFFFFFFFFALDAVCFSPRVKSDPVVISEC
jgi:hypothetical protein